MYVPWWAIIVFLLLLVGLIVALGMREDERFEELEERIEKLEEENNEEE